MITTGTVLDSKHQDDSADLDASTLALVHHAMNNGLDKFTTPTSANDEQRIDWEVVTWVLMVEEDEKDEHNKPRKRPACFKVARKLTMAQFEIVGPEIKFDGGK